MATGWNCDYKEYATNTLPRQQIQGFFYDDGNVYVMKAANVLAGDRYGKKICRKIISRYQNAEIDDAYDFWLLEKILEKQMTKDIDLLTNKLSAGNDSSVGPEYEMYKVGNSTGGNYYIVCANKSSENCTREDNTVSKIVDDVMKQEAIRTKGAPKLVKSDAPQIVAIVTLVAFSALMLVIWRVKL